MKKFFSSEREVKSYSPLDSQISSADFSLVINFPHKIFVPSKPATLQLSKMVWHLKIGQKLRVLGAKTWGVMFFQNFWLKLKGAILGPQNHFWWFQRQNGGFPNGYFGFLKKNWNPSQPFYAYQISAQLTIWQVRNVTTLLCPIIKKSWAASNFPANIRISGAVGFWKARFFEHNQIKTNQTHVIRQNKKKQEGK